MQQERQASPFAHLSGQQRAKKLLGRSLASGRIAHAYLFRGPDGVGKKLFGAAMAKALNCRVDGPSGACGSCLSCRKFDSGNHPDFEVESPEKKAIKIERVRQLCKSLSYPPYESERRVVVIEDVHTMRAEAANSLLKTLEEPPPGNVLILTGETSKNILATISSRCQIVPFFPLTVEETAEILQKKENLHREQSQLLARLAEGSPGQALLLHKTDMIETWKKVTSILSEPKYKNDRYIYTVLQLAGQMADLKENLLPMFGLLRVWLRDILVEKTGVMSCSGVSPFLPQSIFAKLEAIDRAEQELARNCNRSLVCEILLFRLQC
ncbi:MAG: DNA polymerase III subunit delta' [Desulfopila sp.]|jgi:DNA polymerase-3 subunit delta'|nr:DNA polymerase III subunit delta' [Desulfopila sp.]